MNNRRLFLERETLIRWNSSPQDVAEAESFFEFKTSHISCWRKKSTEGLKHRNTTTVFKGRMLGVEIILEEKHRCLIVLFIHCWVTARARIRPDGSQT